MSDVVKLRTRVEIDEEAATWAWRMDSATVTPAQRQAYESWLRQDPRNGRAAREMAQAWRALDGLTDAKRDESIAFGEPAARATAARRHWWLATAAVLAAIAVGVAWLQRAGELQVLATAVGQQRSVTLADGSVVSLNTNTIVETNLQRGAREIYLRKG
jgi:transmembrane sensor